MANEPELFVDHHSVAPSDEGFAYALVTHLPGPLGNNDVKDVKSFSSGREVGYSAAIEALVPQILESSPSDPAADWHYDLDRCITLLRPAIGEIYLPRYL